MAFANVRSGWARDTGRGGGGIVISGTGGAHGSLWPIGVASWAMTACRAHDTSRGDVLVVVRGSSTAQVARAAAKSAYPAEIMALAAGLAGGHGIAIMVGHAQAAWRTHAVQGLGRLSGLERTGHANSQR